jgi:pimeloyl-ACP methyl ester carboxylesterase
VADRRSWHGVAARLADRVQVIAYDFRGFGESEPGNGEFSHLEDLAAVLDHLGPAPVYLVGSSLGGGVALDLALRSAERVAALVLFAPAISGSPEPELDPTTKRFDELLGRAARSGDWAETIRLSLWLWLDGAREPEGRVPEPARQLARDMIGDIERHGLSEGRGASGLDTWSRLEEIQVPALVACGDRDLPFLINRSQELASRLPQGSHVVLPETAHLPYLEQPDAVADVVRGFL